MAWHTPLHTLHILSCDRDKPGSQPQLWSLTGYTIFQFWNSLVEMQEIDIQLLKGSVPESQTLIPI